MEFQYDCDLFATHSAYEIISAANAVFYSRKILIIMLFLVGQVDFLMAMSIILDHHGPLSYLQNVPSCSTRPSSLFPAIG